MKRALPLLIVAALVCWAVDGTAWALPVEADLAERMGNALRALLAGLCLPDALHCSVAPACSGLRTAVAAALLGAFVARRWWCGVAIGALCGLALNLLRLLALELAARADPALGETLHATALLSVILPAALLAWGLCRRLTVPARAFALIAMAEITLLLLCAPLP